MRYTPHSQTLTAKLALLIFAVDLAQRYTIKIETHCYTQTTYLYNSICVENAGITLLQMFDQKACRYDQELRVRLARHKTG